MAPSILVGPDAPEGIVHVGDGGYLRRKGNVLAGNTRRIAAAVPPLVVPAAVIRRHLEALKVEANLSRASRNRTAAGEIILAIRPATGNDRIARDTSRLPAF